MTLRPEIAALVLLAAALHAAWNTFVKVSGDRLLIQTTIIATGSLACALALPFVPVPDAASWPFVAASVVLHNVYFFFLLRAYALGDLSQVYPIARGTSPLLIALLSGPLLGEALSAANFAGVLLVTAGLATLASGGEGRARDPRPIGYAVATGVLIAAFSLSDGIGVRRASDAIAFILWLHAFEILPLGLFVAIARRDRIVPFLRVGGWRGAAGGLMAALAYGIVVWAYSRSPIAPVAALRETSVVMAAVIGAVRLGEPLGARRVAASVVVVIGVALLNLPRPGG